MKLFRFELKAEPGAARSGMVFNGRIYETNGAEAVGVHEPGDVRPLAPVPQAGALRFFRNQNQPFEEVSDPAFFYGNPGAVVGASTVVNVPSNIVDLTFEPYLAAVMVAGGYDIPVEEADDHILGLTIMIALVNRSAMRTEGIFGRSHDLGIGLGPVVTTPDELDDFLASQENGRHYRLSATARVNAVDRARGNAEELPFTIAQAVSAASRSCTLREGDVLALGPLCDVPDDLRLEGGDEVTVAVENLGALSLKLSHEA
ncbi:fumarylacetoacetate hydrolase family protein [bacterium]|nr:MAG: fumarylacetoacetate hydrolase family protein [bacterium]